ncbi:MAG: hypothetical protein ACXAC7_00765 [Candidatus Hodarchaeales archaeon]|jgi:hypothetical protein
MISNSQNLTQDEKKEEKWVNLEKFSKYLGFFLFLILLTQQILKALQPPSFYHPDEIYQSFEIGHYLTYGYGIRSWEWLYKGGDEFDTLPFTLGPYRSLITPLFFYILFTIGELLGLNYWTHILPLIRIILGINFSLGILGLAFVIHELEGDNKRIGWLTFWLLVTFYPDTILIGTRGLTNVIAFSPLWWSLYLYLRSRRFTKFRRIFIAGVIAGFLMGVALWLRPGFILLILLFGIIFFPFPFESLKKYISIIINKLSTKFQPSKNNIQSDIKAENGIKPSFRFYLGGLIKQKWIIVGIAVFIGGVSSFIFNGLLDWIYWDEFAISILNFAEFNKNSEYQSIWGTKPDGWYFEQYGTRPTLDWLWTINQVVILATIIYFFFLILENQNLVSENISDYLKTGGFLIIAIINWFWTINQLVLLIVFLYMLFLLLQDQKLPSEHLTDILRIWALFVICFLVFSWWDGPSQPHKEIRYLYVWEYYFFGFSAYCLSFFSFHITILLENVYQSYWKNSINKIKNTFILKHKNKSFVFFRDTLPLIILIILVIPFFMGFKDDSDNISWNNFDDVLAAQAFVGQQDDLIGLIIIGTFWYDGGFTYLHRNLSVKHIGEPNANLSFNYEFKRPDIYNYVIAPHYKYYWLPSLKANLEEHNWQLFKIILGRTDIWFHSGTN